MNLLIRKMLQKIFDIFTIVFNPSYWTMNYQYSPEWDRRLNELMSKHCFIQSDPSSPYTDTKLGEYNIWIHNYPYAAFRPESSRHNSLSVTPHDRFAFSSRPSRLTIIKANRKLKFDLLGKQDKRALLLDKIGI